MGSDLRRAGLWLTAVAAYWAPWAWLTEGELPRLLWLTVGLVGLPVIAVQVVRSLKVRQHSLVRSTGRLLLDGDPLELARVELRVRKFPITKVPTGYDLSLWVMTSSGPDDVPLGRYRTLVDASHASGLLEDFVQRAGTKQPRHV